MQEIFRVEFKESAFQRMLSYKPQVFPLYFTYNHWKECDEFKQSGSRRECNCHLKLEGCHELTQGYCIEVPSMIGRRYVPRQERMFRLCNQLQTDWTMDADGLPMFRLPNTVFDAIRTKFATSQNTSVIKGPYVYNSNVTPKILPGIREDVSIALYLAEKQYFKDMVITSQTGLRLKPFQNLDVEGMIRTHANPGTEIKSLAQMAWEAASPWVWTKSGLVISSSENIMDNGGRKLYDVMTSYCRPVRGLKPEAESLLSLFPLAIDVVTHLCGATNEVGVHEGLFDLHEIVNSMYLASAGGINDHQQATDNSQEDIRIIQDHNGKKYDVLPAAMKQFVDFFLHDKRPVTTYKVSYKQENYFMEHPSEVDKKKRKGRIYVIPNLITILLEWVISITRKIELGGAIGIGRAWSRGGMDALLKHLGCYDNIDDYVLNEGDVTKIDQNLCDTLINLFFASRLRYFDPKHPDYEKVRKTVLFLIEEFAQKVVNIVGGLWATVVGGVPSGSLDTSHMDSWILLFLWTLFCLDMRRVYPQHAQSIMEALLFRMVMTVTKERIGVTILGDDNWYIIKKGPLVQILNAHQWAAWLLKYFNLELRDVRVGHPIVSVPHNGFLSIKGGVYLRHYCILNPCKQPGQARYIPYRPMKEIVLKVVFGREPNPRDLVNLLMSCLGHAYGTYGGNYFSWLWLRSLYRSILYTTGKPLQELLHFDRAERDIVRKLRQVDVDPEMLYKGFPSLENLYSKNVYDEAYHSRDQMTLRAMQVHLSF